MLKRQQTETFYQSRNNAEPERDADECDEWGASIAARRPSHGWPVPPRVKAVAVSIRRPGVTASMVTAIL